MIDFAPDFSLSIHACRPTAEVAGHVAQLWTYPAAQHLDSLENLAGTNNGHVTYSVYKIQRLAPCKRSCACGIRNFFCYSVTLSTVTARSHADICHSHDTALAGGWWPMDGIITHVN